MSTRHGIIVAFHDFVRYASDFRSGFAVAHPHETFDGSDRAFGVGDGLAFGGCADFALAIVQKADHGRGGACAFVVGDHDGSLPTMTDTQELVVPRSMPIIFPISELNLMELLFWEERLPNLGFIC
jgi:hypothetical protein